MDTTHTQPEITQTVTETPGADPQTETTLNRRTFLQTSALVGGSVAVASQLPLLAKSLSAAVESTPVEHAAAQAVGSRDVYPLADPNNIIYSSCLQCNTGCAIKVKLIDGVIAKIDGSPFSPVNFWPHLPYKTSPLETGGVDGWVCPKGQAGLQSHYDPYRIRRMLKRVGERGENQWGSIAFEQAIEEIVNGGEFADGTTSPGLNEIWALRNAKSIRKPAFAMLAATERVW